MRAGARTLLVLRKGSLQGALIISFSFGITSFSLDFLLYRLTFFEFFQGRVGSISPQSPQHWYSPASRDALWAIDCPASSAHFAESWSCVTGGPGALQVADG